MHEAVDAAGGDALDIGFLDHRRQGFLRGAARLEEAGEVAAAAQLGDAELDRAGAGLPVAVAIAVAVIAPSIAALAVPSTAQAVGLQLHQALRGKADHLAQEVVSEPFSSSSRRAILSSVIVVIPRFRLCLDNPTLPKITAMTAGWPAYARTPGGRSGGPTYPLHHARGRDRW